MENGSRGSQVVLNIQYERVRATEQAPRDPHRVLERRHGLAEIVERGVGVPAERLCVKFPTGELKLRFHLKRAHLLEGLDEACRQELIAHPAAYIRVLNRHTSYEPAAW